MARRTKSLNQDELPDLFGSGEGCDDPAGADLAASVSIPSKTAPPPAVPAKLTAARRSGRGVGPQATITRPAPELAPGPAREVDVVRPNTVKVEERVPTVSELTARIRRALEDGIGSVWVEGEVSNHRKVAASGHQYFILKDANAQLSCVLFRSAAGGRTLADGEQLRLFGEITVYEQRGQYQMRVERVQAQGAGRLQAAFEALKRKLDAEGLFDPQRKKPLPRFPKAIGLVTSPGGAAIQDLLTVLHRRASWVRIFIAPVRVQGDGAAEEIARAIAAFGDHEASGFPAVDLIIAGRGGGSIEDLWAFNEEIVARAIFACPVPLISAVGHEIDFTIADFVADLRAPTPSAAAEHAVPDGAAIMDRLRVLDRAVRRTAANSLANHALRLGALAVNGAVGETARRLDAATQRLDMAALRTAERAADYLRRLDGALREKRRVLETMNPKKVLDRHGAGLVEMGRRLHLTLATELRRREDRLAAISGRVLLLGPQSALDRGYSITRLRDGRVLRNASEAQEGTRLETILAKGRIVSVVSSPAADG